MMKNSAIIITMLFLGSCAMLDSTSYYKHSKDNIYILKRTVCFDARLFPVELSKYVVKSMHIAGNIINRRFGQSAVKIVNNEVEKCKINIFYVDKESHRKKTRLASAKTTLNDAYITVFINAKIVISRHANQYKAFFNFHGIHEDTLYINQLVTLFAHEIGHTINLSHYGRIGDIMYPKHIPCWERLDFYKGLSLEQQINPYRCNTFGPEKAKPIWDNDTIRARQVAKKIKLDLTHDCSAH